MTEFEYLPYLGVVERMTEDDEPTGEYMETYGDPIPMMGNISSPNGRVNQTFYGQDIRYTNTLVMDDPDTDIDEHGQILWKNDVYDIQAVRRTLNAVSIALKKQTSDHADGEDA